MSDANSFPLFDPNVDAHKSSRQSAERFSSSCLDPDARERLAAMYRHNEMDDSDAPENCPEFVQAPEIDLVQVTVPEGLDSILSRVSAEAAAQATEATAAEQGCPETEADAIASEPSQEDLVAEALAAVQAGAGTETPAEAEADVKEFVQEIRREQSLAEIAEAAQNFVAEQTGEVLAAEPMTETPGRSLSRDHFGSDRVDRSPGPRSRTARRVARLRHALGTDRRSCEALRCKGRRGNGSRRRAGHRRR